MPDQENKKFILSKNLRQTLLSGKNLHAMRESGLMPEEAIGTLLRIKNARPDDFTKNKHYRQIVEYQSSKAVSKAVNEGKGDLLAHLVGSNSGTGGTSSFRKIQKFQNYISEAGKVYYLDGRPDSGKTNMALFMAELWQEKLKGDVASNMRSCNAVKTVESFNELKKFFSEKGHKLFVFDDASNHASGYAGDRKAMENKMRKLTNFIAKDKASIIFIGHTGKDVHADIRRKARKLEKRSVKHVAVYKDIGKDGKGKNKKMSISGIPKVKNKFSYDPYEKTKWNWNIEDDKEERKDYDVAIKKIKELANSNKTVIKRSKDLSGLKTSETEKAMRNFAESNSDWRFKDKPHRLQKRVI